MKRLLFILLVVVLIMAVALPVFADKPTSLDGNGNGKDFVTDAGFDEWGYNYRAHMFSGDYCDAYKGAAWCQPYVGTDLIMKWNDAWLSNLDQDGDGDLDRHYGHASYVGSGAWLTNHMSGEDVGEDGQTVKWVYFTKIVAKDTEDQDCSAIGGAEIWGDFCTIQTVYNEQGGPHGIELLSQQPGFGPQN
jgi:hypothetical protein